MAKKPVENPDQVLALRVAQVVEYLNQRVGARYRVIDSTKRKIGARFKEGFSVDDFKSVIDKKTAEWENDAVMCKYLRPDTLFGTKFEGYLNQKESTLSRFKDERNQGSVDHGEYSHLVGARFRQSSASRPF